MALREGIRRRDARLLPVRRRWDNRMKIEKPGRRFGQRLAWKVKVRDLQKKG